MIRHIYLDTRTSDSDVNYDAMWRIDDPAMNIMNDFAVTVRSVEFHNTVYPTNEFNNLLAFTENGITLYTLTIPPNIYTGTTMASMLQLMMNGTDPITLATVFTPTHTYTASYTSGKNTLTISATGNFTFVLTNNSVYESLGLNENLFTTPASSWTSAYPVTLSGTNYVDIVSNLSNSSYTPRKLGHILCRVPVTVPFGNTVFYQNEFDDDSDLSTLHLDNINITMYDDHGNYYKLPDNTHVSIVLRIKDTSSTTQNPEFHYQ